MWFFIVGCFFFQAEDGIRDLVRSRGLGDVYKRQLEEGVIYVPGEYCFPGEGEPIRPNTIRLSFGVQLSLIHI